MKEKRPLKYLYIISACMVIVLCGWLCYKYIKGDKFDNVVKLDTTLNYTFDVSGTQVFHIEKNSIASFNYVISNTHKESLYYEIYYNTSNNLTGVIIGEVVEDKAKVTESVNTSKVLGKGKSIKVPLVIVNNSNNDIEISVGVILSSVDKEITYGSNDYPNGTKITSIYKLRDIKESNCFEKIENEIKVTYCVTEKKEEDTSIPSESIQTRDISGANSPVLAEGMIPIVYKGSNWVKADANNKENNWYNYDAKMWANAVMVKSAKRESYMNSSVGTEVKEEDVLAYYVWIPRYKYKLFNIEHKEASHDDVDYPYPICTSNCPQMIDVIFESGTNSTGETKCQISEIGVETCTNKVNGNYYTHPAFTFGDTELEGIWVGKFETTGNAINPTIRPNEKALTHQNVSNQFMSSQKFASTTYLTKNGVSKTDSHMMKNIEWGAVAYLKQSKYGLGLTDISYNNSSRTSAYGSMGYTGQSAGSPATLYDNPPWTGTYDYKGLGLKKEYVDGTGTLVNIDTPKNGNYYYSAWKNIGTNDNPIWKSSIQGCKYCYNTLIYSFTLKNDGVLTFDYSVSCDNSNYDYLYYTIKEGNTVIEKNGKISGTSYGTKDSDMQYILKTYVLESGTYTLEFTHKNGNSSNKGINSAYVKNVKVLENAEIKTTYLGIEQGGGAASTTGNVTGVYDMSGGNIEYVMGVMQEKDNNKRSPMSGLTSAYNSGFVGKVLEHDYNGTTISGVGSGVIDSGNTLSFPDAKYYDLYANVGHHEDSHLGDALGETAGWYSDDVWYENYVEGLEGNFWFQRGGVYRSDFYNNKWIGIFAFSNGSGSADRNSAFRSVLSITK